MKRSIVINSLLVMAIIGTLIVMAIPFLIRLLGE